MKQFLAWLPKISLLQVILISTIPSFARSYSGTVVDLSGIGVPGVEITSHGFATATDAQGQWGLTVPNSIRTRTAKAIPSRQILLNTNGHIGLIIDGKDIRGRIIEGFATKNAALGSSQKTAASDGDTVMVKWNGKRLIRLPVTNDSSGIVFAIDTSWNDDHGIPWNPRITYGSLADSRDGKVYRTVKIGYQTWMAENLNYKSPDSDSTWWYNNNADSGAKYGRLYTWSAAIAGKRACVMNLDKIQTQGICPPGWHVPHDTDWAVLKITVDPTDTKSAIVLKSTSGCFYPDGKYPPAKGVHPDTISCNGTDAFGFRGLGGGYSYVDPISGMVFDGAPHASEYWTATDTTRCFIILHREEAWNNSEEAKHVWFAPETIDFYFWKKTRGSSLRCVKN